MRSYVYLIVSFVLLFGASGWAGPTFGDLAVVMAKGYFRKHVSREASLAECAAFLNRHGVCFSMFDLMDPNAEVAKEDFARVVGQATLLSLGEARVEQGCIQRPDEAVSWVDFCLLNDVGLRVLWERFLRRTEKGMLPEVKKFYGRAG